MKSVSSQAGGINTVGVSLFPDVRPVSPRDAAPSNPPSPVCRSVEQVWIIMAGLDTAGR